MTILDNYLKVKNHVSNLAKEYGRLDDDITIIAVSKTFPFQDIQQAIDSGIHLFGENKIQEAKEKYPKLKGDFSFHLIGHLQSNKAKEAVKYFDLIHSIDKISTANKLSQSADNINKVQDILVQVNTSGEESKSGIEPEETLSFCEAIAKLPNLKLKGLMTIGPLTDNDDEIRKSFELLRNLKEEVNKKIIPVKHLSMGMSGDYKIAIQEGATLLRIGSAIFGNRTYDI